MCGCESSGLWTKSWTKEVALDCAIHEHEGRNFMEESQITKVAFCPRVGTPDVDKTSRGQKKWRTSMKHQIIKELFCPRGALVGKVPVRGQKNTLVISHSTMKLAPWSLAFLPSRGLSFVHVFVHDSEPANRTHPATLRTRVRRPP